MKIKEWELITIKVEDVRPDPDNPNIVTNRQLTAMKESMKRYGFLVPIIITKDNLIIDGEHRWKIYKEFNRETIPAYKIDVSDSDRRILRQIMNKIKGTHDPNRDIIELKKILEDFDDIEVKRMLALESKDLENLRKKIQKEDSEGQIPENTLFEVVVTCETEEAQEITYNKLIKEGYKCRVLTL